jgi:delta1-piperideine-2-carboxylate reductase
MAGPLIGDLTSIESQEYDQGAGVTPFHGELIIAFDPKIFTGGDAEQHAHRAERMFNAIVSQGARLPSQRRYEARARSLSAGVVSIPGDLYNEIQSLR